MVETEKVKSKSKRLDKKDLIKAIKIMSAMHDEIVLLQEAYMKEQQALFHEKWKVRYLTRRLKAISLSGFVNKPVAEL